jgi:hypothetical protein
MNIIFLIIKNKSSLHNRNVFRRSRLGVSPVGTYYRVRKLWLWRPFRVAHVHPREGLTLSCSHTPGELIMHPGHQDTAPFSLGETNNLNLQYLQWHNHLPPSSCHSEKSPLQFSPNVLPKIIDWNVNKRSRFPLNINKD